MLGLLGDVGGTRETPASLWLDGLLLGSNLLRHVDGLCNLHVSLCREDRPQLTQIAAVGLMHS